MRTLISGMAVSILAAVIAGCHREAVKPVVTQPVQVKVVEVRYVPIDPRLTRPLDALPWATTFGQVWTKATTADSLKATADARLACIASIQDKPVAGELPDCAK